MTVFDQAFIKAYKQQRPALKSVFPETAQPAPGANVEIDGPQVPAALRSAEAKLNDLMSSLEKRSHNIVRRQDPAEAAYSSAGMHLSAEKQRGNKAAVSPPVKRTIKDKPGPRGKKKTSQAPTLEELDLPKAVYRLDPPSSTVPQAPQTTSFTSSSAREKVSAESNIRVFQPMLQVD